MNRVCRIIGLMRPLEYLLLPFVIFVENADGNMTKRKLIRAERRWHNDLSIAIRLR